MKYTLGRSELEAESRDLTPQRTCMDGRPNARPPHLLDAARRHSPPIVGPLCLCIGSSHRWEAVRRTYRASDVGRDLGEGILAAHSAELVD
jgi:hypothetical protein